MGQSHSYQYALPYGEQKNGESHIYRNADHHNKLLDNFDGETTVQGVFLRTCQRAPNNKCVGRQVQIGEHSKHYVYKTYIEVKQTSEILGSGIINLNLIPNILEYQQNKLKLIGIFSKNREEWLILDIANTLYGNTMVPLYETLGLDSIPYILQQTEIITLFVSKQTAEIMLKINNYGALKYIITFDQLNEEIIQKLQEKGLKVINYENVLESGKQKIHEYAQVKGDDIFTFSYTSGTTGMPKGVMLKHQNFVSVAGGVTYQGIQLFPTDVYLSYLPLPHSLERVIVTALLGFGCLICMYGGDVQKINQDILLVKPTLFASVPRLYRRLYNVMKEKLDKLEGYQKTLYQQALSSKMYYLKKNGTTYHKVWDKLVFKKTKEAFGGRLRIMLSGSAPISPEIIDFLKCALGVHFLEGYGQTESCGGSFLQREGDPTSGHVGGVFPNIEFKVIDVPQMNYYSTDKNEQGILTPRGEICIRGYGLFSGYFKDPEKTQETLDQDGWLHSGDIGLIKQDGSLQIIDRVKNIFKLSQGEYIAPEKIEAIYLKVKGIAEIYVYGDSTKSFCVGIIVPEKQFVIDLSTLLGIQGNYEELCQKQEINKYYLDSMIKQGKEDKLNGMEQIKKIFIEPNSFIQYGLVSSTMKLMRFKAKEHFKQQLSKMYEGSE